MEQVSSLELTLMYFLAAVPKRRVIRIVQEQRDARYNMLRGYFHGIDDDSVDELDHERLGTVSLRRGNGRSVPLSDQTLLQGGDTLVFSDTPAALAVAENTLLRA